jgi:SAM-dependent methyltransferase
VAHERPAACDPALADLLGPVMDVEGKIPRVLDALGPLAGRAVAVLDVPGTAWLDRLRGVGVSPLVVPAGGDGDALRIDAQPASLDAVVSLWTGFRGVDAADLAEVDRVLRPGGRLLVVHDYGRDDVSALHDPTAPAYRSWSRREGPFLRSGAFRIRVVHAFWTFPDLDAAALALAAFGDAGAAMASGLKRPRLSWNVAVYHRWQGGVAPPEPVEDTAPAAG